MSKVKGELLTCDRCGETIFLKYLGKGDADGGYTTWDKYENAEGWGYEVRYNLCPKCMEEYKEMINDFFGKKVV